MLENFRMSNLNPVSTPRVVNVNDEDSLEAIEKPYRRAIGCLLYIATVARPDNFFMRIFRYSKEILDHEIVFWKNKLLQLFTNADFGGDTESRKSTSGYVIEYAGEAISWGSKKQAAVALSTAEAIFISACEATKELL
ncbi:hypothetical protein JTB14_007915 [Gonioctena quinquepunctata]|nr:hypothetical protein JTB14_007915 [Gonioctena quinquepunctata]